MQRWLIVGRRPIAFHKGRYHTKVARQDIDKLKADLAEDWSEVVGAAVLARKGGNLLATLELAFSAGRHAECDFIEWLDREALNAYVHLDPCNTSQTEDVA